MRGFRGGMMGGGGFRMGRKFASGDLQLVILALLVEQPRHGYELIKLLEERSGGFYVPSPGVIYPALTYLEETGLADVESEGTKKLYRITQSGRRLVEENQSMIDMTLGKLEKIGAKMAHVRRIFDPESRNGDRDEDGFPEDKSEVATARMLLKSALRLRYPWSKDEAKRIAGILERAAGEILAGGRSGE
jgi:DNA-binding PadR family transcriptional regulator